MGTAHHSKPFRQAMPALQDLNSDIRKPQMKRFNWKYLVLIALVFLIVKQLAVYLGETVSQQTQVVNKDIRVVASSQDAEGATQQDLGISFLNALEAYTVERVRLKTKEALASQGHLNANLNIVSEAVYVESGAMKLAVIRLRISGINSVYIMGIIGKELKRVGCVRESPEVIPISYGVCGEKIKEVFGTMIGK